MSKRFVDQYHSIPLPIRETIMQYLNGQDLVRFYSAMKDTRFWELRIFYKFVVKHRIHHSLVWPSCRINRILHGAVSQDLSELSQICLKIVFVEWRNCQFLDWGSIANRCNIKLFPRDYFSRVEDLESSLEWYHGRITELNLSQSEIGPAGASLLASVLEKGCKGLKTLNLLGNSIGDVGCGLILQALVDGKSEMDELYFYDNNLTAECLINLDRFIRNCKPKVLNFSTNRLGDVGVAMISEIVVHANYMLQKLDVGYNLIGFDGIRSVMRATRCIEYLVLDGNPLDGDGISSLLNGLSTNAIIQNLSLARTVSTPITTDSFTGYFTTTKQSLSSLNFSFTQFVPSVIQSLFERLNSSHLTTLILSHVNVNLMGAKYLSDAIKRGCTIQSLDLSYTAIGTNGACLVLESLLYTNSLNSLDLSGNDIDSRAGRYLSMALQSPECILHTLIIQENELKDDGVKELATSFIVARHFKVVNIGMNQISAIGCNYFAKQLLQSKCTISVLSLLYNIANLDTYHVYRECIRKKKLREAFIGIDQTPLI
jgi:Ran GTPase-activating protein (RanGAP) involved in mRNA processing and transport